MLNQFVPPTEAKELFELGLNVTDCFAAYGKSGAKKLHFPKSEFARIDTKLFIKAILWQQVFDWFRDTYLLYESIEPDCWNWEKFKTFQYKIVSVNKKIILEEIVDQKYSVRKGCFHTPYEAKLECVRKLILIIKSK